VLQWRYGSATTLHDEILIDPIFRNAFSFVCRPSAIAVFE
jgi:hypothetical protein